MAYSRCSPVEQQIRNIIAFNETAEMYQGHLNDAMVECQQTLEVLDSEEERISNLSNYISKVAESIDNSRVELAEAYNESLNLLNQISPPTPPRSRNPREAGTYSTEYWTSPECEDPWGGPSRAYVPRRRRILGPESFVTPTSVRRKVKIAPAARPLPENVFNTYKPPRSIRMEPTPVPVAPKTRFYMRAPRKRSPERRKLTYSTEEE